MALELDLGTVTPVDVPASEPALTDPFAATEEETPDLFSSIEESPEEIAESRPPNPITTQIVALADANENASGTDVDVITYLDGALARAEARLAAGEEGRIRSDATIKRSLARQVALADDRTMELPQQLRENLRARAAQDSAATFEQNMRTAIEKEALEEIENLAAAGDTTQARILMNRLTPGKMDVADAWREQSVKQMLLAQTAEKFRQEDNEEGWFQMAWSGLVGLFQPSAFSYLGNIDEGVGGFQERFFRFFMPGSDIQFQADALWSMSSEQLAEYLPKLEENIRSNSTNLGAYNPDKALEIIGMLQNPINEDDALGMSLISNAENILNVLPGVGLVPYRALGSAVSVPLLMARSGARKEAAAKVSQAFDTLINQGPEVAMKKHGMDEETIIDNLMPSAVNPVRAGDGDELMVPLAGEANYNAQQVRDFIDEWKLVETERMTSPEEIQAAAVAVADKIATRYGGPLLNFDVTPTKLADGTVVRRVRATLGRPDGKGLFATQREAAGYASQHGYNDILQIEEGGQLRAVRPQEQGYVDMVFHGTGGRISGHIRQSASGKMGPGIYVAPEARVASDYAGPSKLEQLGKNETPNVHPLMINGSKVFGWEQSKSGWTVKDMRTALKELGVPLKRAKSYLADVEKLLDSQSRSFIDSQTFIRDLHKMFDDTATGDDLDSILSIGTKLNKKLEEKGYHGIAGDMWGDLEVAIFDPVNLKPATSREWVQDVSGGWANVVEMDIPDTAFMTNLLKPPQQGFLAKWYKNASQTSDPDMFAKAVQADQKYNKMQKILDKQLTSAFRSLSSNERTWLSQVLAKGQNAERWFTPEEFSTLVERAMGKPPSERMVKAYQQYRFNNDVEHMLRNDGVYREKAIRGFESLKFSAFGDQFDVDVRVDATPSVVPKERVFNLTDEVHYVGDRTLTSSELATKTSQGYIIFKTERPIKLKDGTEIRTFMARKGDLDIRPLRREQLAYSQGGHRLYSDRYFVKQASKGVQPDTGQKFLRNANTFATGATIKDVRDWADVMNRARLAVKEGKDAAFLDGAIFAGRGGKNLPYPSGEEFINDVKSGKIDVDEEFEAVFDRELPSAYSATGEDVSRFIDEDDLKGATAQMTQTGRMYYSSKGDQLRSTKGGLAPTIDPFEAQSQALNNVARMSASFSDFKTSAIDRWVNTYKNFLNLRDLPEDQVNSPIAIFNNSTPKRDMPIALRQQMLGQRESIQRILGFESDFDRGYRHWMRSTAEWIVGDSDNALRKKMSEGVFWLQDNNPVGFLRGLAFDMKLGMFNVGQFFIQTSTMFSALALNPKHGKYGLASAIPVWSYFLSKGSEDVLETLAKRGVHKLAGFEDVTQFKNYVREANRTGFFDLGDDHIMVNDQGPAKTFGSLQGGVHAAREAGRFFFYNAEVLNRLVAHRIAYGEAVERFGIEAADSFQFKELVARRAENYSFNMSNTSKAWWQQGLLSIPTQFWAYNVRMIEAMTGKNFTAGQKARLIGAQFLMAGTGGIPVVAGLAEYVKNKHGVEPDIDSMLGTLDRGLADRMIFEMTDADVMVGEKWGTGSWSSDLVKDLFGMSEYNERPFSSIVAGATGSIMFQTIGPALDIVKYYMTHESGAEEVNLASDEWIKLFKQVSTINNGLKAYMVYNYGIYQSTKGTVLADNVPSQDAVAVAMGFRPHELEISSVGKAYLDDRSEAIKDGANQLKAWRQEAFTRPDLLEENARKANAFVKLLPPEIRRDVIQRAHRSTDPSFYTGIVERMEKVRRKEELYGTIAEGTAE